MRDLKVALAVLLAWSLVFAAAANAHESLALHAVTHSVVAGCIGKLAHDGPRARENAQNALRSAGRAALPLLNLARQADDPELKVYARELYADLEERHLCSKVELLWAWSGGRVRADAVHEQRQSLQTWFEKCDLDWAVPKLDEWEVDFSKDRVVCVFATTAEGLWVEPKAREWVVRKPIVIPAGGGTAPSEYNLRLLILRLPKHAKPISTEGIYAASSNSYGRAESDDRFDY
ncbi:MAG: hypothetical protein AMXMBFR7_10130 [Planctomycetota bacterium]